jgi:carboxyl-terminal processing protease
VTVFGTVGFLINENPYKILFKGDTNPIKEKVGEVKGIIDNYYYEEYDQQELIDGAAKGMVEALNDPYSSYMNEEEYKDSLESVSNSYGGLGILVSVDEEDNLITIISPFAGSPAAKAGLLPGDKIIKVDGVEVSGKDLNKAIGLMKGVPGVTVVVTVMRGENKELLDISVKRDIIKLEEVSNKTYDDIGYIRIPRFYEKCDDDFFKSLDELIAAGINGLVIDVRNNPGGLVNEVCSIADRLVPKGLIIKAKDKNGNEAPYYSDNEEINIPVVLLVNQGSASASEILALALREYDKAVLVGEKTFGKGVIQSVIPLSDNTGIAITSAKYYGIDDKSYHGIGLEPDVKVEINLNQIQNIWNMSLEEDIQLKKALDILNSKK